MSPKIKEITKYRVSFPAGETLEKYKGVHVHVRTEQGIIDVWVSRQGVKEKGKNNHINPNIKNDVIRVMHEQRRVILKYWKKGKSKK